MHTKIPCFATYFYHIPCIQSNMRANINILLLDLVSGIVAIISFLLKRVFCENPGPSVRFRRDDQSQFLQSILMPFIVGFSLLLLFNICIFASFVTDFLPFKFEMYNFSLPNSWDIFNKVNNLERSHWPPDFSCLPIEVKKKKKKEGILMFFYITFIQMQVDRGMLGSRTCCSANLFWGHSTVG